MKTCNAWVDGQSASVHKPFCWRSGEDHSASAAGALQVVEHPLTQPALAPKPEQEGTAHEQSEVQRNQHGQGITPLVHVFGAAVVRGATAIELGDDPIVCHGPSEQARERGEPGPPQGSPKVRTEYLTVKGTKHSFAVRQYQGPVGGAMVLFNNAAKESMPYARSIQPALPNVVPP